MTTLKKLLTPPIFDDKTKTNNSGIYYLPSLPPARYELRAESQGFRPSVVSDIPLGAGLTATFNLTLEVGAVTESISVQALRSAHHRR